MILVLCQRTYSRTTAIERENPFQDEYSGPLPLLNRITAKRLVLWTRLSKNFLQPLIQPNHRMAMPITLPHHQVDDAASQGANRILTVGQGNGYDAARGSDSAGDEQAPPTEAFGQPRGAGPFFLGALDTFDGWTGTRDPRPEEFLADAQPTLPGLDIPEPSAWTPPVSPRRSPRLQEAERKMAADYVEIASEYLLNSASLSRPRGAIAGSPKSADSAKPRGPSKRAF